jgi:hypothetical protein
LGRGVVFPRTAFLKIPLSMISRSCFTGLPKLEFFLDALPGLLDKLERNASSGIYQPIIWNMEFE